MKRHRLWALAALLSLPTPGLAAEAMAPEVTLSNFDRNEYLPQVVYNSNRDEYLVVWHTLDAAQTPARRVYARRMDRYGRALSPRIVVGPTGDGRDRAGAAVAYDSVNDRYLIVYIFDFNGNGSDWDVRGRYASWNLQSLGGEMTITDAGDSEFRPQVAFSWASQTFLVTWTRVPTTGYASVRGALVSGASVGANLPIGTHPSQNRKSPDVAYQPVGDNFLVVYSDGSDVYGRIVTAAGSIGGEIGIAGWPDVEDFPAVASCENYQYVVAWHSEVGGGDRGVFVRFLYGDGTIYTAPILIENGAGDEQYPDISCIRSDIEYLVVWENEYGSGDMGISARRLRATQQLRPAFGLRPVYTGENGVAFSPKVAGGGPGWLAVWEHTRQSNSMQDIHDRATWSLFSDGFEWNNTNQWSSVLP